MPIKKIRPSFTFDADRLAELKAVVPEAFADGKINWGVLREALGDYLEAEDEETEHFGLFWPGKREARRAASLSSNATVVPHPDEGVSEDTTHNTFIEGENLEVLKILRKSYAGRINMIYIDPPYNTGSDLIYADDYSEPLEAYLRRTGQAGEEGQLLTTNRRASGRFHSNWLSMMYPRLQLASQLLADDGLIFVSIDDNEARHLRTIMDEVFGEENFVGQFVWRRKSSISFLAKDFLVVHEYIVVYRRTESATLLDTLRWSHETEPVDHAFQRQNPIRKRIVRAGAELAAAAGGGTGTYRMPAGNYELPSHTVTFLDDAVFEDGVLRQDLPVRGRFTLGQATLNASPETITIQPSGMMYYEKDRTSRAKPPLSIIDDNQWVTRVATSNLNELFDGVEVYSFPKPVALIKYLCHLIPDRDALVLDFFAGSGTTAQAVLELNREDGGDRRFILVQLAEEIEEGSEAVQAGYGTIAEVARERIRRVIDRMQSADEGQFDVHAGEDIGFKCYRLARSNYKPWQDVATDDVTQIEMAFDRFETPLVEGWERADLLTEILLIEGFPLDSAIRPQQQFAHNQVDLITSDFHGHRLLICLDDRIAPQIIDQLDLADRDVFVCLDAALSDEAKVRLSDTGNIHVI